VTEASDIKNQYIGYSESMKSEAACHGDLEVINGDHIYTFSDGSKLIFNRYGGIKAN